MSNRGRQPGRAAFTLSRSVVLVGLMGAGKSTVGKRLSGTLGLSFYDSDQEISDAAGCSISDIFELHGEAIFRDLEQRVLTRLLNLPPCVIATGGGAFMHASVRELIGKKAVSVWLRAELPVLLERVSRRDTRPLLKKGDKSVILSKLMEERYPTYAGADIVIDSDEGQHEAVVDRVCAALHEWSGRHE